MPIYMALMLYSGTRNKYVDKCHKLGLSISYELDGMIVYCGSQTKWLMQFAANIEAMTWSAPVLKRGCFTEAAVDILIIYNLSSNCTVISLTLFYSIFSKTIYTAQ